jgi:predicted nucleotidyltransferase
MAAKVEQFSALLAMVAELESVGYECVLVGGMALVTMGSQRLTRDFDLMLPDDEPTRERLVRAMYRRGMELVTKFRDSGEVQRTVDTVNIAVTKVKAQELRTLPFFDWKSTLRVDLLLDFPVPAREVIKRATRVNLPTGMIRVASREDLIRLKEMAYRDRKKSTDAQDLEFLRKVTPA